MKRKSTPERIISQIKKAGAGKLVFPADFAQLGSSDAIRQSLSRLTKEKVLIRLGQGIYLFPEYDAKLGMLYPSTDDIAQGIAKRDKTRIMPTGLTALNKLGLSTQVPMKVVYLTDGAARKIKVGNRTITFKITTPKILGVKGKISGMVIQALQELGKDQIDDEVIFKIKNILKKEEKKAILHDARLAPEWISKILISITNELQEDGMDKT